MTIVTSHRKTATRLSAAHYQLIKKINIISTPGFKKTTYAAPSNTPKIHNSIAQIAKHLY
jgi:hypothetical protein